MTESPSFPFQSSDYFGNVENLQTLRDNVKELIQHDITTLEELLQSVESTLLFESDSEHHTEQDEVKKKQNQSALFQQLSEQNRRRSHHLTGLAQLIIHLIDHVEEEQHRQHQENQHYQTEIDELRTVIQDLRYGKAHIQNDVQIFKEQLENARNQIDFLVEEKEDLPEGNPYVEEHYYQKDQKIDWLEQELNCLKNKLNFFKNNLKSRSSFQHSKDLRYVYSQQNFFPKQSRQLIFDVNEFEEHNKILSQQNIMLKDQILDLQRQTSRMRKKSIEELFSHQRFLTENDHSSSTQKQEEEVDTSQLAQALLKIRSKQSLFRENSLKEISQKNRLASEFSQNEGDTDILPFTLRDKEPKLIYLTDEESSIHHDQSKYQFDFFDKKQLETVTETKESDISVKQSNKKKGVVVVKSKNMTMTNPTNESREKKQKDIKSKAVSSFMNKLFKKKSEPEEYCKESELSETNKGICSSLVDILVNKRIRRNTSKANQRCSVVV